MSHTGETFQLRTLADIINEIPADRMADCMMELSIVFIAAKKNIEDMGAIAAVRPDSVFSWFDDGKGELGYELDVHPLAPQAENS